MRQVTTELQSTERRRPLPEEGPLSIVYEDEWVIVLDKPPGIVVHPTYKNWSGTLLNSVLWRVRDRADAQPGILTRLDKDTSGLVVMALTPEVHAAMQRDAAAGRVRKEYVAVVRGTPEPASGHIALPLGRDTADRRRVVVREDGAPSETRYEVIDASTERAVAPPMRARHRSNTPDPGAPCVARLAHRRRCGLWRTRYGHRAPGSSRLASHDAASDHATGDRGGSADARRHVPVDQNLTLYSSLKFLPISAARSLISDR